MHCMILGMINCLITGMYEWRHHIVNNVSVQL